jgi:hypothetical protein
MFKQMLKYLFVFLFGYLLIKWVSIPPPFVLADFFISLVLNHLKFFAASIVFFIGSLYTGKIINELIHKTKIWQKRCVWGVILFLEYLGQLLIFSLLFYLGWEQTIVFYSLSLFCGMISNEL